MISPYVIAIIAGWVIAQGLKYVFAVLKTKDLVGNMKQMYLSGNMPSAHTSTVVALATVVGFIDGFDSAVFALAALFAGVVMYDAIMVRRSSGEQGVAIQQLIGELKSKILLPRAAKGHTPVEVLAGLIIGIMVGIVVFIATK